MLNLNLKHVDENEHPLEAKHMALLSFPGKNTIIS